MRHCRVAVWDRRQDERCGDEHLLGAVTVETGALVDDEAVAVELTLNGQQFSDSGRSILSLAFARLGVLAHKWSDCGADIACGARRTFQGGLEYRCRFGNATVNATFVSDERLACTQYQHTSQDSTL